jgi:hypothetical protein
LVAPSPDAVRHALRYLMSAAHDALDLADD